jgi:GNAT superfamily N-acetyltransferase
VHIDLARPGDVEGCLRLAVDLLAHDPRERRAKLRRDVSQTADPRPDRALFVARVDGIVGGYSRVERWTAAADAPATTAPDGWYLMGLLVDPAHRRAGIGRALTVARLDWLRTRTDRVWYFANARNTPSLALHASLGFREVSRTLTFPGVHFAGGVGGPGVAEWARRAVAPPGREAPPAALPENQGRIPQAFLRI